MKSRFSQITVILFLGYGVVLAIGSSSKFPTKVYYGNFFPYLADKPISEDGYYLLTVSWNIAQGKGIVYNYDRPTTGVQPLAAFFYAAIAKAVMIAGGNKFSFARAVIIVSFLLELLFYFSIKGISRNLFPSIENKYLETGAVLATLLNFEILVYFANGLETGLYLFLISIIILYSFKYFNGKKSFASSIIFGLIAGICCLARIDFIAVLAVCLLINFFSRSLSFKQFIIVSVIAAIIVTPWVSYIYLTSGSIFQSSASAQSTFISAGSFFTRLKALSLALMQHLTPDIYSGNKNIILVFIFLGTTAVVYFFLADKKPLGFLKSLNGNMFLSWAAGIIFLITLYVLFSYASYFYLRYTTPLLVIILPLFTVLLARKISGGKERWIRAIYLLFVCMFLIQAVLYFHSGKLGVHQSLRVNYIKTHFNSEASVGCFQSGVTGFYDANVYNLDGKMDAVVHRYLAAGNLPEFLDSTGINVLIEWKGVEWLFRNKQFRDKWAIYSSNIGDNKTVCLVRKADIDKIVKTNLPTNN